MATLQTTINHVARGHTTFELVPNAPTVRDLVDTYQVRLWVHDTLIYDRRHSVRNWQMRHAYIEHIADACRCIDTLLGKVVTCTDADGTVDGAFLSFVHAEIDTDWLTVLLSAASTKSRGDIVHVRLFVEQEHTHVGDVKHRSRGQWGEYQNFLSAYILCTPADVITFGTQLRHEIDTVEHQREALGIPAYDSHDDE